MKQALLLLVLLMFPLWSNGEVQNKRADDNRSAITDTQKERAPTSQKESPNLPCHAQTKVDKAKDMATLGTTPSDCVDDDTIRRNPAHDAGSPLQFL